MARTRERRRRQRIDVALPIKIEYNNEKISAQTKNISILGTYLEADKEIPLGTTLDVGIEIPKSGQVSCKGVAFRCQPIVSAEPKSRYGIGIFFRTFAKGREKEISKYINYFLLREKKRGKIYMRRRKRMLKPKRKGGKK